MSSSTLPRSALYCFNFNYFLQQLNICFFGKIKSQKRLKALIDFIFSLYCKVIKKIPKSLSQLPRVATFCPDFQLKKGNT